MKKSKSSPSPRATSSRGLSPKSRENLTHSSGFSDWVCALIVLAVFFFGLKVAEVLDKTGEIGHSFQSQYSPEQIQGVFLIRRADAK